MAAEVKDTELKERKILETENSENVEKRNTETDPLTQNDVEGKKETTKRTFKETCSHVLRNVTVEPSMFLFIIPCILVHLTTQNLSIEKACRVNLNFSSEICDALRQQTLGEQNEYERDVQHLVARALAWRTYITATIPCALSLFIGSWSDLTGNRKTFIMVPIIGATILCINNMINIFFFYQLSLEVLVISEAIVEGLYGSWCVALLSLFAYISSVTSEEERTFRMGMISFAMTVGVPIGSGISGILIKKVGFYGCYTIAGGIHIINLMYTIFVLKNPKRTPEQTTVSV